MSGMASKLKVDLGERSYEIEIAFDNLAGLGVACREAGLSGRCIVVSDENVAPLYSEQCLDSLSSSGFNASKIVFSAGEPTKCLATLERLYNAMLDHNLDRSSFVVALGGGVIGDLAGFAAASFLRGIRFVQVPTSLLAMVDSSVGGKTGVNLTRGKNLVGAFHQPELVHADLRTLETLGARDYRAGLSEVVKYGLIYDRDFFQLLEENASLLASAERSSVRDDLLERIVIRCCEIKAEVVRQDERESGLRAILNFGHTLGHALENTAGYGKYLHGEGVAIGMVFATRVSLLSGDIVAEDYQRVEQLIRALGLPWQAPECDWKELWSAMSRDKKAVNGHPEWVLLEEIGRVSSGNELEEDLLFKTWRELNGVNQ